MFSDHGFVIELPFSPQIFPLQTYEEIEGKLTNFDSWVSENLVLVHSYGMCREKVISKLILHFDAEKNLVDQSGPYPPDLE